MKFVQNYKFPKIFRCFQQNSHCRTSKSCRTMKIFQNMSNRWKLKVKKTQPTPVYTFWKFEWGGNSLPPSPLTFSLFCCEKFSFGLRLFLLVQNILFNYETFSFTMRLFLSTWDFFFPWDFLFPCENVSTENYSTQVEISGQPYKKDFTGYVGYAQCCEHNLFIVKKRKKFRERRSLQSKNDLVSCITCD